jgi:pimeloyl-ACP methyl ester carboxylesterase
MVTTRYAENDGVRLSYHVHDRFIFWRPRLVLIQGVGFDAAAWAPVVRRLRRRFRLVVLDNRGVGQSDAAEGWYTVSTMVEDVVAVLDQEDIPEAHVLGVSLGGMVAQELAIRHPDRVDRLVLVSTTSGWPFTFPLPARSARLLAVGPMLPRANARRRQLRAMMSRQSLAEQPQLAEQMSTYLGSLPHDRRSKRQQMMAGATYVGGLRQLKIRADTLVLHGSADTVADPRNAAVLANQIAGAELVMFPDSGHLLFWEHPDRFCDVVTGFLRRAVSHRDAFDADGTVSRAVDAGRSMLAGGRGRSD